MRTCVGASRRVVVTWGWMTLLLLLGLAACGEDRKPKSTPPAARIEGPVVVGFVGPLTGDEASYGTSVLTGIQAAAKRFNEQGGLGGKQIELVALDDQSNIESTIRKVKELIDRKVVAILAAPTGSSTFAPIHLVNESNTLFISIGSRRHLKASGPFVLRHALSDELASDALIEHAKTRRGWTKFALVSNANDDFSLDLSSMFRKAVIKHQAAVTVQSDTYDTLTGSRNFAPVVAAIKRSPERLDAVIFTGGAAEAVALLQTLRDGGVNLPMLGGEELHVPEFLAGGAVVEGALLYASYSADRKTPQMDEFLKDMGKPDPDRFAALAYDTFTMLAQAIRGAGSTESAKIREALLVRADFLGATGSSRFSADNQPIKQALIFQVGKANNGSLGFLEPGSETGAVSGK